MKTITAKNMYGKYCVPASSAKTSPPAKKVLDKKVYEPKTIQFIIDNCGSGDIVHAGAYFGDFLPALSKSCHTSAIVWAFEAKREHYECAAETLKLNNITNVNLFHNGVGSKQESQMLQVIKDANTGQVWGGGSRIVENPTAEVESIDMVLIDEVIPSDRKVSVLHFDVEGFEQQALMGSLETIRRCLPVLIVERIEDVDEDWLSQNILSLGYKIMPRRIYLNSILIKERTMLDDVTIIIKTFERPDCVAKSVKSIRKHYPTIRILVGDDSKTPTPIKDVEHVVLPFDTGAAAGRNRLVDRVETKYFITSDDDWVWKQEKIVERFLDIIENNDIDLLSGGWENGNDAIVSTLKLDGNTLTCTSIDLDKEKLFQYCDYSYQFFIADTEKFRSIGGWDDDLKTAGEHLEVYLRAKGKLKVAYTNHIKIYHADGGDANYKRYRTKRSYFGMGMEKHGITKFVNFTGKTREKGKWRKWK